MSRGWDDVFEGLSDEGAQRLLVAEERGGRRGGFFSRLRDNLRKSREAMAGQLAGVLLDRFDDELWESIEVALLTADVGVPATAHIVERATEAANRGGLSTGQDLLDTIRTTVAEMMSVPGADGRGLRIDVNHDPAVILMVGVNGTGKTTSTAKIARRLQQAGRTPLLAAADTFRAAAVEQLSTWAERLDVPVVAQGQGADPGAVAFDALAAAEARNRDVVLVDTAGRLHTQANLMAELAKVRRVIERRMPDAPHATLLVVDAVTGQNGLRQAKEFGEAVPLDGVVLTKLDGSAKGGAAIAIAYELGLPVKLVGIGEGADDLRPFDPEDFASALFDEELLAAGAGGRR